MSFFIRRVQNYCFANGADIYSEAYTDHFNFDEINNQFVKWNFQFPQPDVAQLLIDYPDSVIEQEIALRQLRAYRNAILRDTDKFVTLDYPLTQQTKDEIIAWRQALRDLPGNVSPSLLVLNQYERLQLEDVFPQAPLTGSLLAVRQKFPFVA